MDLDYWAIQPQHKPRIMGPIIISGQPSCKPLILKRAKCHSPKQIAGYTIPNHLLLDLLRGVLVGLQLANFTLHFVKIFSNSSAIPKNFVSFRIKFGDVSPQHHPRNKSIRKFCGKNTSPKKFFSWSIDNGCNYRCS